jgi:hypothetical protein
MSRRFVCLALFGVLAVEACATSVSSPYSPTKAGPILLSVSPSSGATAVDPSKPITVVFNHSMFAGMERLVAVHEGTVAGATIDGTSVWSTDRAQLTFTPSQPLKSKATYTVHLSPNLKDAAGNPIDLAGCARQVGGAAVSGSIMSGGMNGITGGMGPGMMGVGWQPGSGDWGYGMVFIFTTS